MKKLLILLLSALYLNSSIVSAEQEPKEDIFAGKIVPENGDEVVLDNDIKPFLMHALYSKYLAELAARQIVGGYAIPKPLSNINREEFKQFSNAFDSSLSDLVIKCQKHSANFDVMGTQFSCKSLDDFLVMTEQKPSVLEVSDWWSFVFGGYSKSVQPSPQTREKLRRLRQNMVDADSVMGDSKDLVRATLNAKKLKKNH